MVSRPEYAGFETLGSLPSSWPCIVPNPTISQGQDPLGPSGIPNPTSFTPTHQDGCEYHGTTSCPPQCFRSYLTLDQDFFFFGDPTGLRYGRYVLCTKRISDRDQNHLKGPVS